MEQIVINGVNLTELQQKRDEVAREIDRQIRSILPQATEYISNGLDRVKVIVNTLVDEEPVEEHGKVLVAEATEVLKNISFVSEMSGIMLDIPYPDQYGDYWDGTPLSRMLDDAWKEYFSDLYSALENEEGKLTEWNSSYC